MSIIRKLCVFFLAVGIFWIIRSTPGKVSLAQHYSSSINPRGNSSIAWIHPKWQVERADNDVRVGSHNSIAVDSECKPHIAYLDSKYVSLKYATKLDGIWNNSYVDRGVEAGNYNSIVLDGNDKPHISYVAEGALSYARQTDDGFSVTRVDEWIYPMSASRTALVIDSRNLAHIAYQDFVQKRLKYAHWDGTKWVIEIVDEKGQNGWFSSLALDARGIPHVSYIGRDREHRWLNYATKDGAYWTVERVDDIADDVGTPSLRIGQNEDIYIAYVFSGNLTLAKRNEKSWTKSSAYSPKGQIRGLSLELTPRGSVRVVFLELDFRGFDEGILKYAEWDGSKWDISYILVQDHFQEVSFSTALDKNGSMHISYYDRGLASLVYIYER